jgi:hypothetical protein
MRYLLLLLAVCIGTFAKAQTLGDYEEVIYLKNGSVIRGVIIEQVPGKSYKIQTHENNLFVYQYDEIEKITREVPTGSSHGKDGRKAKGFNMYIDEGMALWVSGDPYPMNQLTFTPGYKINRTVFIGGTVGIIARKDFLSVPVMVDARFTFTKTKVAPLLSLQAGYMSKNLLGNDDFGYYYSGTNYGGFIFGIKPGIGINLKKDIDLNFYTGYQLGSDIVKIDNYYDSNTNYGLLHFFTLTAGIKF